MPSLVQLNLGRGVDVAALPRAEVPGLYVHIPFCFHKCHYCDFYSITRQDDARMTRFVDLLLREADLWTGASAPMIRPRTVFFGGGTPSLLPVEQMRRLIRGLSGSSLRTLTAQAKRRLLATALGEERRVPLPFRSRSPALGLFVGLTLSPSRHVMSVPGFRVGAIARDGRSLALLAPSSVHSFGDDRATEILLRRVEDWDRRGRPAESDLHLRLSYAGERSSIRRQWRR